MAPISLHDTLELEPTDRAIEFTCDDPSLPRGEDNLVIGSDYGHADTSTELDALRNLHETTPVAPEILKKILEDNPARFYGL